VKDLMFKFYVESFLKRLETEKRKRKYMCLSMFLCIFFVTVRSDKNRGWNATDFKSHPIILFPTKMI